MSTSLVQHRQGLPKEIRAEVVALAARQRAAQGGLTRFVLSLGGKAEAGLAALPEPLRARLIDLARDGLGRSYDLAQSGPLARIASARTHRALGAASGALGGMGGLASATLEIPFTITLIFSAVQQVAASHGEDPAAAQTRLDCLHVFGSGGPGEADDGIDTAFLGARATLTGPALQAVIARIAPRVAAVLGQKLAGQAVPLLGAAAGAGTNYAFLRYYTEIAHVHFGLKKLTRQHGVEAILDHFHAELARRGLPSGQDEPPVL